MIPTNKIRLNSPASQQGASVSSIMFIVIAIVLLIKIGLGVVPSQINNYQLNKMIMEQLQKSNANKDNVNQFLSSLDQKLSMNADYNTKVDEIITFTSDNPGNLKVHVSYEDVDNFFYNIYIVNRYSADISDSKIETQNLPLK